MIRQYLPIRDLTPMLLLTIVLQKKRLYILAGGQLVDGFILLGGTRLQTC